MGIDQRLLQEVLDLETRLVPDLKIRQGSSGESKEGASAANGVDYCLKPVPPVGGGKWVYFAPSYYVQTGLLDAQLIDGLKGGGRVLSVGAGPAYLERFLSVYCSTQEGQIVLADRAENVMPQAFPHHVFDATCAWPVTDEFDYVLFPESFSMCVKGRVGGNTDPFDPETSNSYYSLLKSALTATRPGGEVRAQHLNPAVLYFHKAHILQQLRDNFPGLVELREDLLCFTLKRD